MNVILFTLELMLSFELDSTLYVERLDSNDHLVLSFVASMGRAVVAG